MKPTAFSALLDVDVAEAITKADVAYVAFGDGSRRAATIEALARRPGATLLAEKMLLSGDTRALPFQSPTVVATAIAVLALGGAASGKRLEALRKKGTPAARMHARAALGVSPSKPELASIAALGGKDAKARARAVDLAAEAAVPEALPALRAALADPQPAIRGSAARALGTLGDAEAYGPLRALLGARPKVPPASSRGARPAAIVDAMAAYDGLVRLGDARALADILALAASPRYVAWVAALAETTPLAAMAQFQPVGIVAIAERALVEPSALDEPTYTPVMSDAHATDAATRFLARWRSTGPAAARKKRDAIAARLTEAL